MDIAALPGNFGLRETLAAVTDLKFPVLVIPSDYCRVGVAPDADGMLSAVVGSNLTPSNGTLVIDADFNFFIQQNVKCRQGEIGMLFRAFVRPGKPITFTMDLKLLDMHGLQLALQSIAQCASIGEGNTPEKRLEVSRQTTTAGIVEVLTRRVVFDAPP